MNNSEQVTYDTQQFTVRGISPRDAYKHLQALCNNGTNFTIHKNPTQEDLGGLTIGDLQAIRAKGNRTARGSIIGTVRLLPKGTDTDIQFVHKDAGWNDPFINPALWQVFIKAVKEYFDHLQMTKPATVYAERVEKTKKPRSQIYERATIWRELRGWMKLGNVRPTPKDCIEELKKKPTYRDKVPSAKRMQKILNEGFGGEYDEILNHV
jgi:hypothetical protein